MLGEKCAGALGVVGVIADSGWGTGGIAFLRLCCSLVRSRLDCSCVVFGSTGASCLRAFGAVHHRGLRLCLRAFLAQPDGAVGPPLDLRRRKLSLRCIVGLRVNIDGRAFGCVFSPQCENLYDKSGGCVKSIGFGVQGHIDDSGVPLDAVPSEPLWSSTLETAWA